MPLISQVVLEKMISQVVLEKSRGERSGASIIPVPRGTSKASGRS